MSIVHLNLIDSKPTYEEILEMALKVQPKRPVPELESLEPIYSYDGHVVGYKNRNTNKRFLADPLTLLNKNPL